MKKPLHQLQPAKLAALQPTVDPATAQWVEQTYLHLHQHPELSGQEEATAQFLLRQLQELPDWQVTPSVGGHGIVAVRRNGDGPCVLMRADMDGLPVEETTGVAYASRATQLNAAGQVVPTMHACGHDVHMASLLGAMRELDRLAADWSGTVVAVFQPAEEASAGAKAMIADGLGELIPRPDVCLAQHVVAGPAGAVFVAPGPVMTSSTTIEVTLFGRGAHASMPHRSIDPVVMAANLVLRLQTIVSREVHPGKFAVVTVAAVEAGTANNVIAEEAKLSLSCRFYDDDVREYCLAAIQRMVAAEAAAAGCEREPRVEVVGSLEATDNSPLVVDVLRPVFDAAFREDSRTMEPWSASEDFPVIPAFFGVPYVLWTVGITPRVQWDAAVAAGTVDAEIPSNHNPNFLPDLSSLTVGVRAATLAVLACLQQWGGA